MHDKEWDKRDLKSGRSKVQKGREKKGREDTNNEGGKKDDQTERMAGVGAENTKQT